MELDINSLDLLLVAAGVMTYAIGAAIWTCREMPALLRHTPAPNHAANIPFKLEKSNEFL